MPESGPDDEGVVVLIGGSCGLTADGADVDDDNKVKGERKAMLERYFR
jgi:hypothetical protein